MSGEVKQNSSVATGVIGAAPTATESGVVPAKTTNPEDVGAEWHNTTTGEIFICYDNSVDGNIWKGQKGTNVGTPFMGDRAVWGGGNLTGGGSPTVTNVMQYNNMDSTGNSTDFGDLIVARGGVPVGASGDGRGTFAGGYTAPGNSSTIEYINISALGNATTFGQLGASMSGNGASDGVRGWIRHGGTVNIYQWTIATLGDAWLWSELEAGNDTGYTIGAGCSLQDRMFFGGGSFDGSAEDVISYKSTLNDAVCVDFGNLQEGVYQVGGSSNGTYGFFFGGHVAAGGVTDKIQRITIATTGNATDFGNLINPGTMNPGACGRPSRMMVAGGGPTGGNTQSNIIQYFAPASNTNALDFGDLIAAVNGPGGLCGD